MNEADAASFTSFHSTFSSLVAKNPAVYVCAESSSTALFHEAGVFIPETSEVFITSNRLNDSSTGLPKISITKVDLSSTPTKHEIIETDIAMGNGGIKYKDGILFCDQGNLERPGGLVYMSARSPYTTKTILDSYHGTWFNSVNDVVVAKDGAIWFTDPIYGYEQGFRPRPRLPQQVYRFDPSDGTIRAMADGFGRPNGIAFSPDEKTVYITDTDHIHGDGTIDEARASSIYAYKISHHTSTQSPYLHDRRLFAFAPGRAPDGIKVDGKGNVYSGCLDGIMVWAPDGTPLGNINIPGGVANFCFCGENLILAMNETRLWKVELR